MLYDKRWDAKVKADPHTLESLIAWLEKQPAAKRYQFMNCSGRCLYGQYLEAMGHSYEAETKLWSGRRYLFRSFVYEEIAGLYPCTFGAALARARALTPG